MSPSDLSLDSLRDIKRKNKRDKAAQGLVVARQALLLYCTYWRSKISNIKVGVILKIQIEIEIITLSILVSKFASASGNSTA
jgi:hypothetical protein